MKTFIKRRLILSSLLIFSSVTLKAQAPAQSGREFTINIPESRVEFFVGSSTGDVNGVFQSCIGKLRQATLGVPESATLKLDISAATMSTGSGAKDKVVKGKDFFYVRSYPAVTFNSRMVIPSSDPNKFHVQGDFTLRGITKPATLQVILDPESNETGHIYADLSFDRRDFGMTKDVPLVSVSDSVRVRLDLNLLADTVVSAPPKYSWASVVRIKVPN